MAHVIVESEFEEPFSEADGTERARRLGPCIEQRGVKWINSFLSKDGRRLVCHFDAVDAETVRMAHRTAGVTFKKVWPAELLAPQPDPEPFAGS